MIHRPFAEELSLRSRWWLSVFSLARIEWSREDEPISNRAGGPTRQIRLLVHAASRSGRRAVIARTLQEPPMSTDFSHGLPERFSATPCALRLTPTPPMPDQAARDRFAKRRAAGTIAAALAAAVGRSPAESGTARLATLLAADAGALKIARGTGVAEVPVSMEVKPQLTVVTRSTRESFARSFT